MNGIRYNELLLSDSVRYLFIFSLTPTLYKIKIIPKLFRVVAYLAFMTYA